MNYNRTNCEINVPNAEHIILNEIKWIYEGISTCLFYISKNFPRLFFVSKLFNNECSQIQMLSYFIFILDTF